MRLSAKHAEFAEEHAKEKRKRNVEEVRNLQREEGPAPQEATVLLSRFASLQIGKSAIRERKGGIQHGLVAGQRWKGKNHGHARSNAKKTSRCHVVTFTHDFT